jgi:hypothetical protein
MTDSDCLTAKLTLPEAKALHYFGTYRDWSSYRSVAFAVQAASPRQLWSNDQMNWDRIEGNWKQLTGKVKEQWGN